MRTLALEQVDDVAVVVGRTWNSTCRGCSISRSTYSVPSPNAANASRRACAIAAGRDAVVAHGLHADAAAAFRWLEQHGEADAARCVGNRLVGLIGRRLARDDGHAGLDRDAARGDLRPMPSIASGGGPMNVSPAVLQAAAKSRSRRGTRSRDGWLVRRFVVLQMRIASIER